MSHVLWCKNGPDCSMRGKLFDFDWLNSHITSWCQKSSPWSQGRKTPFGRKERTTYSTLHTKRKRKWYKKYSEKRHLQKKKRNTCGYRGACISKDDRTKGRGFNDSIKTKTKQKKTNVTPEKDVMTSAKQTPGGPKFAPLVASQQGRANQNEPACFGLSSSWPFCHVRAYHCMPSSSLGFLCNDQFRHEMFPSCSAVLRHSPSSWAAVVHWSALMPKALRSSMKHPIHSFSWPRTQPAPSTISPNITHFGSFVPSMRATNTASKIRILRKVASMLSLPVLISVSR